MKRVMYIAVAFARMFFPTEAKLAYDVAHAETISEFAGISASKGSTGNLRAVNLNETPIMQNKRLFTRIEALMKTGMQACSIILQCLLSLCSILL